MLPNLVLVENGGTWVAVNGTTELLGLLWDHVRARRRFLVRVPGNECVLVVVELLVGCQVELIHLFLHVCHIADLPKSFFALHLSTEVTFVHHHCMALLITLLLLILLMEEACLMGTDRILLLLSLEHGRLCSCIVLNLGL